MSAVARNPQVTGGHPLHGSIVVEQDLCSRKAGEYLDSELLRLPGEPAAEIAEAQSICAVIAHEGRHQHLGNRELPLPAQHPVMVFGHPHAQGRALVLPVGDQLVERNRIDDGAREDVGADLAALFEDAYRDLASGFIRELLQANGGADAGGSAADDHHIISHGFAFAHPLPSTPRWRGAGVSSRCPHISTQMPCQFLDRGVNGGRGSHPWAGTWQ